MNKMVDLHNHSLPSVDDGAKTMEEAIDNIKYLKKNGIKEIILTSHYIVNSNYNANLKTRKKIYNSLVEKLNSKDIKLYLGNEVFINDSETILNLLKKKEIATLNDSKYLLVEFPLNYKVRHLDNIICELNDAGYIPIIAHPERYINYQKNYNKLKDLLEYNCLLQCNLGSILGEYGRSAKKLFKKLIKDDVVTFIATDFHHITDEAKFEKAFKKLNKLVSPEKLKDLIENNPKLVLKNKDIKGKRKTLIKA